MKWRENIAMKALAFMAAVAAFTATAILSWYQIANFDALWSDEYTGAHGYTLQYLVRRDYDSVSYLARLYEKRDQGTELTFPERRALEQFEARYDPAATNLRWQLLDQDGKFLYGNTREDSGRVKPDYWKQFELNDPDRPGVESTWSYYTEIEEEALNAGDYSEPVCDDMWREVLPELTGMVSAVEDLNESHLEWSDYSIQPDTILADTDGQTLVLWVRTPDGLYLYYPTVRACLEANKFGYILDPYGPEWTLEAQPTDESEDASGGGSYANLLLWVDRELRVSDSYKRAADKLAQWQSDKEGYLALTIVLGAAGILLMVYLCCGAGHKRGEEGIYLNWFHRIPADVLLSLLFLGGASCVFIGLNVSIENYSYLYAPMYVQLIVLGLTVSLAAALGMAALITVCARCKAHTLLRNTWTWAFCAWCWGLFERMGRAVQAIPLIWKAVLSCMAYPIFTMATIRWAAGLWLLVSFLAAAYLCTWAYQWKRIRRGAQEIIGGNPGYQIDTRRMLPDLRGHADDLNNLVHAISAAVDDRMKSEHFKADIHHQLCGPAEKGGDHRLQGGGVYRGAGPQEPAAEEADGGPGGGLQGVHRKPDGKLGAAGLGPAHRPGPGGVRRPAGGPGADGGALPAGGAHLGKRGRAAPVAGAGQSADQLRQVRPAGHPGLSGPAGNGELGGAVGEEHQPGRPGHPRRAAHGALCPGGRIPHRLGQRAGPVHRPVPHRASARQI